MKNYYYYSLVVYGFLKGGIFPENSEDLIKTFQNAVRILNTSNELLKLQVITATVNTNDSFVVQKAVCEMIEKDIAALFGPNTPKTAGKVRKRSQTQRKTTKIGKMYIFSSPQVS